MDLRGNPPEGEDILLLDIGEQLTTDPVGEFVHGGAWPAYCFMSKAAFWAHEPTV